MLDKSSGAVTCGHCHRLEASVVCPWCRQMVCSTCRDQDCPAARPRELRLGMGWRLRGVDETGRFGHAGFVLGSQRLVDLDTGQDLRPLPDLHQRWTIDYLGPCTLSQGTMAWVVSIRDLTMPEHQQPYYAKVGLMTAPLTATGVGSTSFTQLSEASTMQEPGDNRCLLRLAHSGTASICLVGLDDRILYVNLASRQRTATLDLNHQVMHALAVSVEHDLLAVGMFESVELYTFSERRRLGARRVGGGNVTHLSFSGKRLALVNEGRELEVLQFELDGSWRPIYVGEVGCSGRPREAEISLSPDGALVAMRHRRKQVRVVRLADGVDQRLRGHTDRINLVRFTAGGPLITADKDNRVVIWPRTGDRIVEAQP